MHAPGSGAAGRRRPASAAVYAILIAIVVGGLLVRVVNNDYGLPYVYNFDEDEHFTSRAVNMFSGDFDPGYYQNPSGFTYAVHLTLRLLYAQWPLVGSVLEIPLDTVGQQFTLDPTPIWIVARTLAAVLAMLGVVAVFFVGRRLWDARVGLVAAAVLAFAFLPVTYSRIAVTDVGTFLPVILSLYGAVRVYERGARRDYLLAGAGAGLAMGFKYTTGLLLLPLLAAVALRLLSAPDPASGRPAGLGPLRSLGVRGALRGLWSLRRRPEVAHAALALAAAGVVFFLTTPFFFANPIRSLYQLKTQAVAAGGVEKLGQTESSGWIYYLKTLTWGFGWLATGAAALGAVAVLRRDRARGALLLLFPVALFLYMGAQSRYFGRWLLPAYPVLALLAGVALVRAVDALRVPALARVGALAAATAAVLVQPVEADVRTAAVLGRTDTRNLARDFLVERYPDDLRVAIDPALPVVPELYMKLREPGADRELAASVCTGLGKGVAGRARPEPGCVPTNQRRFATGYLEDIRDEVSIFEGGRSANLTMLTAGLVDRYREQGYCLVVTFSTVRQRAEVSRNARVLGYYRRLERESDVVFRASPFRKGAKPPPFDFDRSFNYYPRAFVRPGPEVTIYRLRRCTQRFDNVPEHPKGMRGLLKGAPTSYSRG